MMSPDVLECTECPQAIDTVRPRDELLALLGHELRSPLTVIRNAVHLLREKGDDEATRTWTTGLLERQSQRLGCLLDDLLDISPFTQGKLLLAKQPIDLAQSITRAVETVSAVIGARHHQLEVSLPQDAVYLFADPTRLEQILVNLLTNAAKYTVPGGQILLKVRREEEEVVFRVRDNGTGITREMLPHVFDLFWQGERTLDHAHGGLGIGLALVRKLVEMHGGSVSGVSAGPGRGSEFVVRLPAAAAPVPSAAETASVRQPALPKRMLRVLVVDDYVDTTESMARLLQAWGHEVETAPDGMAALGVARAWRPQVVLLDIGLPDMDGCEVARLLRKQAGCETTLLVAVTGYGQEADRLRSYEAGFDIHLVKPLEPVELQELLARHESTESFGKRPRPLPSNELGESYGEKSQ